MDLIRNCKLAARYAHPRSPHRLATNAWQSARRFGCARRPVLPRSAARTIYGADIQILPTGNSCGYQDEPHDFAFRVDRSSAERDAILVEFREFAESSRPESRWDLPLRGLPASCA